MSSIAFVRARHRWFLMIPTIITGSLFSWTFQNSSPSASYQSLTQDGSIFRIRTCRHFPSDVTFHALRSLASLSLASYWRGREKCPVWMDSITWQDGWETCQSIRDEQRTRYQNPLRDISVLHDNQLDEYWLRQHSSQY